MAQLTKTTPQTGRQSLWIIFASSVLLQFPYEKSDLDFPDNRGQMIWGTLALLILFVTFVLSFPAIRDVRLLFVLCVAVGNFLPKLIAEWLKGKRWDKWKKGHCQKESRDFTWRDRFLCCEWVKVISSLAVLTCTVLLFLVSTVIAFFSGVGGQVFYNCLLMFALCLLLLSLFFDLIAVLEAAYVANRAA